MTLQKQVNILFEAGKAGTRASDNPVAFYPDTCKAGVDGVLIANFCWMTADVGIVANKAIASEKPLGFVFGEQMHPISTITDGSSMKIPAGYTVSVAQKGDFWAVSDNAVIAGQKVFANTTTGAITGGNAGATIAGSVETDFSILETADIGTPFKIQKL